MKILYLPRMVKGADLIVSFLSETTEEHENLITLCNTLLKPEEYKVFNLTVIVEWTVMQTLFYKGMLKDVYGEALRGVTQEDYDNENTFNQNKLIDDYGDDL